MSQNEEIVGQKILGQMMEYQLTLTHFLERAARMNGNRPIHSPGRDGNMRTTTYRECYQRVCQLARALQKLGIRQGDRIGTLAWNGMEHFELYYAVPGVGAVLHTLNLRLSSEQLDYIINHAEDRVIFVDASLASLLEKIAPNLKSVEKYVIIGGSADFKTTLSPVVHYEELFSEFEKVSEEYLWPVLDENQAAGLCYTSGTTGNPKGALYSHRSQFLHAMGVAMADSFGLRSADVILLTVPMFHASGWGLPYASVMVGAEIVLPGKAYQAPDLAQVIQKFRITVAGGVPTLWMGLLQYLKVHPCDMSSLRGIIMAGSAVPRSLIQTYEEEFKVPILHFWGMTELSPAGTCSGLLEGNKGSLEQRLDQKVRQGFAVPCVEIRVVAQKEKGEVEQPWDGKSCGELQVRGPWVISSYFRDPVGSTSHNQNSFTEDGWFKTGDVAVIDENGSMAIVDRTKDLIKSGGEWISSVELENALMSHPHVHEAVVIGVQDEKWSERPLALVVPKPGVYLTSEDLQAELSKKFVKFWIPERIQFVTEIPKTSVGKFDKKKLREEFGKILFNGPSE